MNASSTTLEKLDAGHHACWSVNDASTYRDDVATLLSHGKRQKQKPLVFGPADSASLTQLASETVTTMDPHVAFLDEGQLQPEAMFAAFREQTALARADGYTGLRVVADMDWLLGPAPSSEEIVGFELMLDRLVAEVDATIVCAYRRSTFDAETVDGVLAVHPLQLGHDEPPQFRFISDRDNTWRLSGEVDLAVRRTFGAALGAAASGGTCVVNIADLSFVDVAGLRMIAEAAHSAETLVELRGASAAVRRSWELLDFGRFAPKVRLAG